MTQVSSVLSYMSHAWTADIGGWVNAHARWSGYMVITIDQPAMGPLNMLWTVGLPFRDRTIECSCSLSCCLCLGPFSTSIVTRDTKWLHFASFEVLNYRSDPDWKFTVLCLLYKSICLYMRPETLIRTRASVLLHASSHCVVLFTVGSWILRDRRASASEETKHGQWLHLHDYIEV
jgi:hypothetical protein